MNCILRERREQFTNHPRSQHNIQANHKPMFLFKSIKRTSNEITTDYAKEDSK
jgi:hypothetical protein